MTSRPGLRQAEDDGLLVRRAVVPLLAHARHEKDLVVHREPEQHREEHHRDPGLDLVVRDQAGPRARAPREHDHEEPVRRSDGEQVQDDRLQREQHRAERAHEQEVRRDEDCEHEPREPAVDEVDEVLAARRASAGVHAGRLREPGRRHDLPAEALDELEALRLAVVLAPDDLEVEVALRRVDVLGRRLEAHGRDLRIRLEQTRELRRRANHRRIPDAALPARVDDDDRRCDRSRADRVAQHVVAAHGLEVARNPLVRAGPELEGEHRAE